MRDGPKGAARLWPLVAWVSWVFTSGYAVGGLGFLPSFPITVVGRSRIGVTCSKVALT